MAQSSSAKKAAGSGLEDRISDLPDGVLQHVLGLLPAADAVRTCVLARRWRHTWKSTRRLHVTKPWEGCLMDSFVNPLLLLRDRCSTLEEVKFDYDSDFVDHFDVWFRHVVSCQARVLAVQFPGDTLVTLKGPRLESQHLRRLQLTGVDLEGNFLDFACCPALEAFEMKECNTCAERISSQSLRHLCIEAHNFNNDIRTRVSVPGLIWLQLKSFGGKAPILESMPLLETAFVEPGYKGEDYCGKGISAECCGICADCFGDDHKGGCLLLGGLSNVQNLELIAYPGTYIFRRDMRWCPTFSKLKRLLLNDWCVAIDLAALVCILQHSPVLEILILQLNKRPKFQNEMQRSYCLVEKSAAISEHLKIIKVDCQVVDERIFEILKFLSTLDVEITLKRTKKRFQHVSALRTENEG